MVEKVEELRAEVQAHPFPRQGELFDDGKVGVHKARPRHRNTKRVPQLAWCRRNKAGRVNPLIQSAVGRVGVATRNLIRAVEVVSVATVVEGRKLSGSVRAVDQGHAEA